MRFLDFLSPIVGGVSSVVGLIQDSAARQQAQQQAQQALQQYGSAADQQYQNMLGNNTRTLMGAAGTGGTALTNLGANMGSALAGAGVYNSSATAGALTQAQANENTGIANLAAQDTYNANSFLNQAHQNIAQMQLGQANTNYGYANNDLNASRQGLGNFLGALGSSNLLGGGQQGAAAPYDSSYENAQTAAVPNSDIFSPTLGNAQQGLTNFGALPGGPATIQSLPPIGSPAAMGALTQMNLTNMGANANRTALPTMPGTINQGANLGGNAGGIGNGGQGAGGSNPFYQQPNPWAGPLSRYTNGQSGVLGGR